MNQLLNLNTSRNSGKKDFIKSERVKNIILKNKEKSTKEIAKIAGVSDGTIRQLSLKNNIHILKISERRGNIANQSVQRLAKFSNSDAQFRRLFYKLTEKTLISAYSLRKHCEKHDVQCPENIYTAKENKNANNLIKIKGKPPTLEEIAKELGSTNREFSRQYLHATNQFIFWNNLKKKYIKDKSEIKEKRISVMSKLVSTLEDLTLNLSKELGYAEQKTIEYLKKTNPTYNRPSFDKLVNFFNVSKNIKEKYISIGYHELEKMTGMSHSSVQKLLKFTNIHPLIRINKGKLKLTNEDVIRINRAYGLKLSIAECSHFLNLPYPVIEQRFLKLGKRPIHEKRYFKQFSQVYESLDLGFTRDETAELFCKSKSFVKSAIINRKKIEKKIIRSMEKIYKQKFEKPYL